WTTHRRHAHRHTGRSNCTLARPLVPCKPAEDLPRRHSLKSQLFPTPRCKYVSLTPFPLRSEVNIELTRTLCPPSHSELKLPPVVITLASDVCEGTQSPGSPAVARVLRAELAPRHASPTSYRAVPCNASRGLRRFCHRTS